MCTCGSCPTGRCSCSMSRRRGRSWSWTRTCIVIMSRSQGSLWLFVFLWIRCSRWIAWGFCRIGKTNPKTAWHWISACRCRNGRDPSMSWTLTVFSSRQWYCRCFGSFCLTQFACRLLRVFCLKSTCSDGLCSRATIGSTFLTTCYNNSSEHTHTAPNYCFAVN